MPWTFHVYGNILLAFFIFEYNLSGTFLKFSLFVYYYYSILLVGEDLLGHSPAMMQLHGKERKRANFGLTDDIHGSLAPRVDADRT